VSTAQALAGDAVPLLELRDVELSYGPFRALFGVSFVLPEHEAVALVGPNGSGKTSVARVVSGLVRADRGSLRLGGRDVTRWPAWRIARAGVIQVPEGRCVLGSLSVEENLVLAFEHLAGGRRVAEAVDATFDRFTVLRRRRHQVAGTLSGGEQRILALARALQLRPRLLVVDELSLGLSPAVLDEICTTLAEIVAEGSGLLVIEQHADRVTSLASRRVVLERGRVVEG
jgi:branched-chain amino acid transport system ATP-binding protein